jgi:hypothetical protein
MKEAESLTPYFAQLTVRYKSGRMLQVCIMPGPSAPKGDGYWSFLAPLLDELQNLSKHGMDVECDDGQERHSKVHLLVATGDIPGVSTLASHSGHTSEYGCRVCPIQGVHGASGHGQYFVPNPDNLSLPWWHTEDFLEGSHEVCKGGDKVDDMVNL